MRTVRSQSPMRAVEQATRRSASARVGEAGRQAQHNDLLKASSIPSTSSFGACPCAPFSCS